MEIDRYENLADLDIDPIRCDLRRDLHMYLDYVRDREVKRGHRDNGFNKPDARRLAKMCSDPRVVSEIEEGGFSRWLSFVDQFALKLGLVHYDTKGVYAGYSSHEPSFPDNYIKFDVKAYDKLVSMTIAESETYILNTLLKNSKGEDSEFHGYPYLGRLDRFSCWGVATGIIPFLDFTSARRILLEELARCPIGEWLSVQSFVAHLKKYNRFFLIPEKLPDVSFRDPTRKRYGNFYEGTISSRNNIEIKDDQPDAFERVEGRYVERFLEGAPYLLGYVDVAYAAGSPTDIRPTLGYLKAFRVSNRLQRVLSGTIAEATLRVTPSFEVYVQSELYPARLLRDLGPLCDVRMKDAVTVFRLERQKVAAACAADANLDVTRLLESSSREPLPANVLRELADWSAHGEKFILYTGFALLECNGPLADLEQFHVEKIADTLDLVHSPGRLYDELEKQELAPLRIKHGDSALSLVPATAQSVFPRKSTAKREQPKSKNKVALKRVTRIQLFCPDSLFFDCLLQALVEAKCPIEADRKNLSLSYSRQQSREVEQVISMLKKEFDVKIEDQ